MSQDPQATAERKYPYTFGGAFTRSVDSKGRFHLPFRFRSKSGGGPVEDEEREKYMFSPGHDGSITLMPHSVWEDNFNRMRSDEPTDEDIRNRRLMSLMSRMVQPDAQGRVAIPAEFKALLGLDKKVTVVGMGTYMELWVPEEAENLPQDQDGLGAGFLRNFYR